MTLQIFNDVANGAESAQKFANYVIMASLKRETIVKLINRIPGLGLLISSLPGSALRTLVELLGKPPDVNKRIKALPGKLDIKRHSPSILYVAYTYYHINQQTELKISPTK